MNSYLVNFLKDNELDYKSQLLKYTLGILNQGEPIIIDINSKNLSYANIKKSSIIVIKKQTMKKIQEKHKIPGDILINLDKLINNSVFAFDSIQNKSRIFVLNQKLNNNLIIFTVKESKINDVVCNEITSVYDRDNLQNLIKSTCDAQKNFYINPDNEIEFLNLDLAIPTKMICNMKNISYQTEQNIKDKFNLTQSEQQLLESLKKIKQ